MINSIERAVSRESPKQVLFSQFAALAKSLSHPHRLELLEQLAQVERSVDALARPAGVSVAKASQQLQHMLRAGVMASRRDGKVVLYRLADDAVLDLLASLGKIAGRTVAEVQHLTRSYFNKLGDLEPVTRKELLRRVRAGSVTVLDVRPEDEFALAH